VLTTDELRKLFPPTQEKLLEIWKTQAYAALFLTMATTGIRSGEARALAWRHLLPDGWLLVERAEINTEGRNLVAHSLRHSYNTLMRAVLPEEVLRRFTGHKTPKMSATYDHPALLDQIKKLAQSRGIVEAAWK
jgi:integrase